ncbi:hypothetical protein C8R43DRAFT_1049968 [Mycena crocata]|nr:hypothetical protein C8R43DRAFT_1049968 [Mycena crocata]
MDLSPGLKRLRITHGAPVEPEVVAARRIVTDGREKVAEIKAQIATLLAEQKRVEEYVADHERILYSINKFPPEILSRIFLFTLTPLKTSHTLYELSKTGSESPWLLGRVCGFWREVALSTQAIWAFPIAGTPGTGSPSVNLQLARSGTAALHPRLCGPTRPADANGRTGKDLISIFRQAHSWLSVFLALNWNLIETKTNLAMYVAGHLDRLEELHVQGVWREGTVLPFGSRLDAFAVAPRLRALTVQNICEPAISLILPWTQLTHYRGFGSAPEHLAVLQRTPNLISAHLTFLSLGTVAPASPVLVSLPQLRKFHLVNAEFLHIMSIPALQDVILDNMPPDVDPLLPLLACCRREKPPLRAITLVRSALMTPTLITLLEENPTIETLRIYVRRVDTAAVDALVLALRRNPADTTCFAPNLRTLEFSGRGALDEEAFLSMVHWRFPAADCNRAEHGRVYRTADDGVSHLTHRRKYTGSNQEGESHTSSNQMDTDDDADVACTCQRLHQVVLRMAPKASLAPRTVESLYALAREGLVVANHSLFADDGNGAGEVCSLLRGD